MAPPSLRGRGHALFVIGGVLPHALTPLQFFDALIAAAFTEAFAAGFASEFALARAIGACPGDLAAFAAQRRTPRHSAVVR